MSEAKKVLIVEDNELNMKLFNDLLKTKGHEVFQATNGKDALEVARDSKPDLILMDMQLPDVYGLTVTGWIRKEPGFDTIPIVAITAFAMRGDEEKFLEGGCSGYISKPISVTGFLESVEKYLSAA